jgi:hypothetical protein
MYHREQSSGKISEECQGPDDLFTRLLRTMETEGTQDAYAPDQDHDRPADPTALTSVATGRERIVCLFSLTSNLHTHSADHHHSQTQAKCIAWAAGTRLALYDSVSTPQGRCRCCGDNPSPTDSAAALPVEVRIWLSRSRIFAVQQFKGFETHKFPVPES